MADIVTNVLVIRSSEDCWCMMDVDLSKVKDVWELNKDYYRVERWYYIDTEHGHELTKKEVVLDVDTKG